MRFRQTSRLLGSGLLLCSLLMAAAPAAATNPGDPGRIAYGEMLEAEPWGYHSDLYTMNPDGSDQRRLTFDGGTLVKVILGDAPDEHEYYYTWSGVPAWSPDGTQLAFLRYTVEDQIDLVIIDPATDYTQVVFADWEGTMLSWSPDAQRIAYGDDRGVWIANADGSTPMLVTTPSTGQFPNPPGVASAIVSIRWSPDGTQLAFEEWTGGGMVAGMSFVGVVNIDGTNRRSFPCSLGVSGGLNTLDWSPSSERLLCDELNGEMLTIEPDGSGLTSLGDGDYPAWSPTGSEIVHGRGALWGDQRELWATSVPSGAKQRLLDEFRGYNLAWQPLPLIPQSVGLVDPATGLWRLAGSDGRRMAFYYGVPGDVPFLGDWDCDGIDTPGLYRQSDGFVYLRNSNTQGIADIRFYFGNPGDVPIAGDFNGDGCDTVSIYRQTEGRVYVINRIGSGDSGLGAADFWYYFGNPGDKPFVGDFDGDGIDTVGLHRESSGLVYFRNSHTQGVAEFEFFFGDPGDRLVAGDWSDNGLDTPGVFRPEDRTFYLRYTNSQGNADEQFLWGWPHWIPVAGHTG